MERPENLITREEAIAALGTGIRNFDIALRKKLITPVKSGELWYFDKQEIESYKIHKHVRDLNRRTNGDRVFDESKGHYSVPTVAKMYGVTRSKVYHLVRSKKLNTFRVGSTYVVIIDDKTTWEQVVVPKTN